MKHRLPVLLLVLATALSSMAAADDYKEKTTTKNNDDAERVLKATAVIQEFSAMKEGAPTGLVEKAQGIVVIPDLLKASLVAGAKFGNGLLSTRMANGEWSQPVHVKLAGGSVGFQAGVSSTDLVLLFMQDRNIHEVLDGEFTLTGEANVAAGPLGREGSAGTDVHFDAPVYSYSRSKGVFAGVSVDGSKLSLDKDANARVYGGGQDVHQLVLKAPASGSPEANFTLAVKSLTSREAPPAATGSR